MLKLLEAISESLGLEKGYMDKALSKQAQHMAINYYPPCPQPELTYGLPGHKDPNALTVLLQDQVPGLQVLFGGKWVTVKPIPGTFVVNIGDQIQVTNINSPEMLQLFTFDRQGKVFTDLCLEFFCSGKDYFISILWLTLIKVIFGHSMNGFRDLTKQ